MAMKRLRLALFFDVTSLYAGTMQKMMPLGNYKWNTCITLAEILQTPEDSNVGYFVEVDLKYPSHLHDSHNGLPLAPEKVCIRPSWLSPYANSFGVKASKTPKLVETIKKLRLPLSEFEVLCKTWAPSFKVTSCLRVPAKHMVGGVHREEHRYAKASYQ